MDGEGIIMKDDTKPTVEGNTDSAGAGPGANGADENVQQEKTLKKKGQTIHTDQSLSFRTQNWRVNLSKSQKYRCLPLGDRLTL